MHRVLPGSGNNWVSRKYLICFPTASSKESPKRLPEVSIASFVSEQSGYSPWELESERDKKIQKDLELKGEPIRSCSGEPGVD